MIMTKVGLLALILATHAFLAVGAAHTDRNAVSNDGLRAVGITMDDNFRITGITDDSDWSGKVEIGDTMIAWSDRRNSHYQFNWENHLDDLGDFLCEHDGDDVYIWVENHRDNEGYLLRVSVEDDDDDCT